MHLRATRRSGISSIAAACSALRAAVFVLLLGAVSPLAAQTAPSKFIPMFLVYYGGGPALVATDAAKLAKFDLLDIDRFRYNQLAPTTWSAIKAVNPNIGIYLYEMGPESQNYMDATPVVSINGLGRYDVSRGHSMGSLDGNHPELFLLDSSGKRIYNAGFSNPAANQFWYLMDFGSPAYQAYWIEAVKTDIATQPWVADGVHADNCLTFSAAGGYSGTSSTYPTDAAWSGAMNNFSSAIAAGLHGFGQKLWCNKGSSYVPGGPAAWLALDASADHPDVLAEEGAFAVTFGPWATQFISEPNWKMQVDTMAAIKNSKVAMFSSTAMGEGQSGTDNWGQPVTYWQTLWYSLGSFLLGKNDTLNNAYFGFFGNGGAYDRIWWYDEYDKIDLGKALGPYTVTTISGVNVYSREFQKGYVYVNPTATNVASVPLPQASQQLTHDNLLSLLSSIPIVNAISLNGHNAAIVLKTVAAPVTDTTPPTIPTGVSASAGSSTQINLSWVASTDNVGVTGYRVYRGGALLTTLGAVTTLQNTGLSASTTYSYTVQAIDAAGNASGQSIAASATTLAAPDTSAPSTPSGLTASATSSSQISLSWTASTDNVGVTGYRVYRGGALLVTLGAVITYQNTGLSPSTTYSYTVQAIDAAGNASGQSVAVSASTPASPDATAPSTPSGLGASAVSSSQISLSWTASTDNVGVTGYRVYRGGALLVTLGAVTTLQNTGLSPLATYSYTVQAVDAAGNASGQSAAASATTPAAADTVSPTVPTGLKGKAVSATQINLTWNASTDNVGVAGYTVYLNDVVLANTTTRSFQHTGLTPGNTYAYRVSAFDAAHNNSGWTATPVSVKTPVRRIVRSDFDGNGKSDILWRNAATGDNAIWLMSGATIASGTTFSTVADPTWKIAGVGDFDGDGKADILWRNGAGGNLIWLMNGAAILSEAAVNWVTDFNWSIAGIGDFDGDGRSDILWHNGATGANTIWLMNGGTISGGAVAFATIADLNWGVAGIGDFDGDGKSDILWHNSATGENLLWLMNGAAIVSAVSSNAMADLNWSIAGTGDFDGDGKSDILWRNRVTGQDAIWFMNGATLSSSPAIGTLADLNWTIAEVGDFDGDGKADILWRNQATGQDTVWLMNGATLSSGLSTSAVADLNWSIMPR
jgi:chitodextrinase